MNRADTQTHDLQSQFLLWVIYLRVSYQTLQVLRASERVPLDVLVSNTFREFSPHLDERRKGEDDIHCQPSSLLLAELFAQDDDEKPTHT